ncbi:hypothetical protein [Panacagrimonas sp.]|uniref:hypothetical protein n=1 Tax=Panacagrimonas sp. TaxID=2480088 RepID=UPI003B51C6C8
MDLSTEFKPVAARDVFIKHPVTDEPTGLVFMLRPMTDPKVKAAKHRITNSRLQSRKGKITSEQMESQGVELMIAAIEGWRWEGAATWGGKKPEFTEQNLRDVIKNDEIRKQIDAELGDDAAFFKG